MRFTFNNKMEYSCVWYAKEKTGQLFFTRGLPRCGKSNFSRSWLLNQIYSYRYMIDNRSTEINMPLKRVIVCADDFRLATYGTEYKHCCEHISSATTFTAIKALLMTHCVLFDDTNSSEWSLRRIFEICPQAEYINIGTEKKICLERNNKTKNIPEFVFDRIEKQLLEIDPENIRKDYI